MTHVWSHRHASETLSGRPLGSHQGDGEPRSGNVPGHDGRHGHLEDLALVDGPEAQGGGRGTRGGIRQRVRYGVISKGFQNVQIETGSGTDFRPSTSLKENAVQTPAETRNATQGTDGHHRAVAHLYGMVSSSPYSAPASAGFRTGWSGTPSSVTGRVSDVATSSSLGRGQRARQPGEGS